MEKVKKPFKIINKSLLMIFVFLFIAIAFVGIYCKKLYNSEHKSEAINQIKNIISYRTDVEIIVKNSKQDLSYKGKEVFIGDRGSKLSLDKNTYILKNGTLLVRDNNSMEYYASEDADIYKLCFLDEYKKYLYLDTELHNDLKSYKGRQCDTIRFELSGNNKNLKNACIYYDIENKVPMEIKIFNHEDKETLSIKYDKFETNIKIDDKEF